MSKHRKSNNFQSLSLAINKRPQTASNGTISTMLSQNIENKSLSTSNISCIIQKNLENLLRHENFFKSPDLTRISYKEKRSEFAKASQKIRLINKSAEYQEIPFNLPGSEYDKFRINFHNNITNKKGFFLYTQNPLSRKSQQDLIEKVQKESMNWNPNKAFKNLMKKKIHNNGKISIINELKSKSLSILNEALERKCAKEEIEDYKLEITKKIDEMIELNETLTKEKYEFSVFIILKK